MTFDNKNNTIVQGLLFDLSLIIYRKEFGLIVIVTLEPAIAFNLMYVQSGVLVNARNSDISTEHRLRALEAPQSARLT